MKFAFTLLATSLALTDAYTVGGSGGSHASCFSCGPTQSVYDFRGGRRGRWSKRARGPIYDSDRVGRFRRREQRKEMVDQAFENLAQELKDRKGRRNRRNDDEDDPDQSDRRSPSGDTGTPNNGSNPQDFFGGSPKDQKEFLDEAVDFLADIGRMDEEDVDILRDISNRGFELVRDIASGSYSPAYNIQETDEELEISLDVPGVDKEDIEIVLEDAGILTVSGKRDMGNRIVPFSRSFPVDGGANVIDKVSANLADGVLVILVPKEKSESSSGRRIDID